MNNKYNTTAEKINADENVLLGAVIAKYDKPEAVDVSGADVTYTPYKQISWHNSTGVGVVIKMDILDDDDSTYTLTTSGGWPQCCIARVTKIYSSANGTTAENITIHR